MEINSVIDLSQNLIQNEQSFDLTEENPTFTEGEFQEILSQEITPQEQLLKIPSESLPVAGNELPLDVMPSSQDNSLIELNIDQPLPLKNNEIEDKKEETLPFVMTQLLMELPTKPLELHHATERLTSSTILIEQGTKVLTMALNEPVIGTVQEQATTPMAAGIAIDFAISEPSKRESDRSKELNVILKGSANPIDETSQAIKLSSEKIQNPLDMQPIIPTELQNILAENEVQLVEMSPSLFENKLNFEVESAAEQRSMPLMNELHAPKEPFKQSMAVTEANIGTSHFSDIFENKLLDNVTVMLRRNENVTQIQIDPPELGKIDITIEQNDDKTDIRFMTQVDQTKQLIENSLDRLKLQLAQNGIELGQVDVNSGNQEEPRELLKQTRFDFETSREEPVTTAPVLAQTNQLLDLYI